MGKELSDINSEYDYQLASRELERLWNDADDSVENKERAAALKKAIEAYEPKRGTPKVQEGPWLESRAREAYRFYGADSDYKNFQGNPMPEWEQLPADIRAHWRAVIIGIYSSL